MGKKIAYLIHMESHLIDLLNSSIRIIGFLLDFLVGFVLTFGFCLKVKVHYERVLNHHLKQEQQYQER